MDKFRLQPSIGRKEDIDKTVTDLDLWQYVLESWGYWKAGKWHTYSPLSIGKMLSEYERLEQEQPRHASSNEESIRPKHLSRDG
jgi:hypothetical protein